MKLRWCVVYGDGSAVHSEDYSPFYVPQLDVQMVLFEQPGNKDHPFGISHGKEGFYWNDEQCRFVGCDEGGMWDYWFTYKGPKACLFGRTMLPPDSFWALHTKVRRAGLDYGKT